MAEYSSNLICLSFFSAHFAGSSGLERAGGEKEAEKADL